MIRTIVNWGTILLSLGVIAAAAGWLWLESRLAAWEPPAPGIAAERAAFVHGPIGLEVFPLKYAAVLDRVSGSAFRPDPSDPRSVWEIWGFLPNPAATGAPLCAATAATELPFGFNVTTFLPERAAHTPLAFVGLTCAACHSGRVRGPEGPGPVIVGMGNPELDVIAFSDAVRAAILDPGLTADRILAAYGAACPEDRPGWLAGRVERFLLDAWIAGFRESVAGGVLRYGLPVPAADLRSAEAIPAGPGRTRPFRSVVRVALDLPGEENFAFSKIPAVWEQAEEMRPRSQYDGSIADPVTRSMIAAYASGATPLALSKPAVAWSVRAAAAFTERLGLDPAAPVPRFSEAFPGLAAPDPAALAQGMAEYRTHCADCHGWRDPATGRWVPKGARLHAYMPVAEIGTDPERVLFPHGRLLPLALWTALPLQLDGLAAQKARLAGAAEAALAAGRHGEAWLWEARLRALRMAARQFRLGHPLAFPEARGPAAGCDAEARAEAAPDPDPAAIADCALTAQRAYFTNPIPHAWLRAPYLHNGAVPTLAQLLNLRDRPARFCRGANPYDPEGVGLHAPAPGPDGTCPAAMPFLFDTALRGNSHAGHDYPWPRAEVAGNPEREAVLSRILLYLRTI